MSKLRRKNQESRAVFPLAAKLNHRLAAYVAAASAAGVACFAATPSAEAKVVYSSANISVFSPYGWSSLQVDINGDGVPDLGFFGDTFPYGTYLKVYAPTGGGIAGANFNASALKWGARIGPKLALSSKAHNIASVGGCHSSNCGYYGPWDNTVGHFLGVKFLISGEVHYGWVSLNVGKRPYINGTFITGYAYETIPNKPIIAGAKSGPNIAETNDSPPLTVAARPPATLGMLAQGANALSLWRREEQEASQDFRPL